MLNKFYVYVHYRNDTNEIFYVGKGFGERAYSNYGRSKWWNNIVKKHGHCVEILHDNLNEQIAFDLESHYIQCYGRADLQEGNLVNLTDGGEGHSGYKVSKKTRKTLSILNSGEKHPNFGKRGIASHNFGKHHSEETRKKMSILNSGEKNPNFGKRGIEMPNFGKSPSIETRKKISESQKGEKNHNFGKKLSLEIRQKMRDGWALRRLKQTKSKITIQENNTWH